MKRLLKIVSMLSVLAMVIGACSPAATPAATEPPKIEPTQPPEPTAMPEPTEVPWTAPDGALISIKAEAAPALDGVGDEAFWADAPALEIPVSGGANMGSAKVTLKSVYLGDTVYFLMTYADPTLSEQRAPWRLGEDGAWAKLKDPNDKGGDNNIYYEDKFSMMWPINNSVPQFEAVGCFAGCHASDGTGKPFGNKYFEAAGALADLWHWKSIRNLNQIDDQYVDTTTYDKDKSPEAGRHSDPKDSGGYVDNQTDDKTMPAFGLPDNQPAPPYYILDSEKVPFDAAKYKPGDEVPGIVKSEIVGDRGNIAAGWKYAGGKWTIEFGRQLVTGSEFDVQFSNLAATYFFGVAVFDNAQVRHAFQQGSSPFVFQP